MSCRRIWTGRSLDEELLEVGRAHRQQLVSVHLRSISHSYMHSWKSMSGEASRERRLGACLVSRADGESNLRFVGRIEVVAASRRSSSCCSVSKTSWKAALTRSAPVDVLGARGPSGLPSARYEAAMPAGSHSAAH